MKQKNITTRVDTKEYHELQKKLDEHGITFAMWLRSHVKRTLIMKDFIITPQELEFLHREQTQLRESIRREMANKSPELFGRYFPGEKIEDFLNVPGRGLRAVKKVKA